MAIRPRLALLALVFTFVLAPSASGARPEPAADSRVFLIVLENHELDEVFGSAEAPFLNELTQHAAWASRYYAVAHPSLPNYLALLGGSTFGIAENCIACQARDPNLALQLSRAGVSWRAYMGDMPRPCFTAAESGDYVKRHDPFMYFPLIASNRERCRRVVPAARLDRDLRSHSLPSFGWLSPGLCDDAHDCDLATADRYLSRLVPRVMRGLGPGGNLIVTFDEGTSDEGCCGPFDQGGGRVLTVIASPGETVGRRLTGTYNHYSLPAAVERHFGLPRLRAARQAEALPLSTASLRSPRG